jgi:hypothetical protein
MASFAVFDLAVSKRVFAVDGTSTRVFAMHEQVGVFGGGAGEPFYHVVESPYEDFDDDFTRLRACEITLERSGSTAAWRVDGRKVYEAHTLIPERAQIGFGIWTMLPERDGRSLTGRAWTRGGAGSVCAGSTREQVVQSASEPGTRVASLSCRNFARGPGSRVRSVYAAITSSGIVLQLARI